MRVRSKVSCGSNSRVTALDLAESELVTVRNILAVHVPHAEVWAFGSRVSGGSHPGSDLDLVIRNPKNLETAEQGLAALKAAFSESDLPFLVDVIDWARLPESFQREIDRGHIVVQAGS